MTKEEYDGSPSYHTYKSCKRLDFSTGTRRHYTKLAVWTQHKCSGSLHNTCVSRAALQSQWSVVMDRIYLGSKSNWQFYRKKPSTISYDTSTGHSTTRKCHYLCNSLVASIGHQWRQMMDRQWIFVWTNVPILKNKVTLRQVKAGLWVCYAGFRLAQRLLMVGELSVLWSKAAQILQMSFSNKVVISVTPA